MEIPIEAPAQTFGCRRRISSGATWLHLSGALDIASSSWLSGALREGLADRPIVVLDLEQLEFLDCSGVHAIETAAVEALMAGRRLMVARVPAAILRIFTLTGVHLALEFYDLAGEAREVPSGRFFGAGS